ncbi:MAG TPA: SpoIID/LytB domain-containing protein [Acidimicrobiales bacterium]|nr:SpoIID/LytB domain-containing protein [Acidimicrobiales bacterium]
MRRGIAALVTAAVLGAPLVSVATPASAAPFPSSVVTLTGHGFGHGHGMGQWGALGYALAQTPYQSIVAHYYGGTTLSALSGPAEATQVGVEISENNNNTVIVTSGSPFTAAGLPVGAGQAALMTNNGSGGSWNVTVGGGCAGPWNGGVAANVTNPTAVPSHNPDLGDPATGSEALQLCQGGTGGNLTLRGNIEGTDYQGQPRTVNVVPLEQYVAGVVPNESPAYWGGLGGAGPQGQPWGFQELEAQAVAARSYVMAGLGSYFGYTDTCDLTCQTYQGTKNESALSDLAATATAGQVMEFPSGTVAATQYSASTGGYTNPGNSQGFPAVPDTGDSICVPGACNPNHTWTASVPVSQIQADWPQLGTLQAFHVTARNGFGDFGGRVTSLTLVGSNQNVTMTGDQFAGTVGLMSNWFTTSTVLNKPIVGMAATPNGQGYWLVASDGGIFSYGNASYVGSTGAIALNRPIVGMAATPDGRGYWLVASDGGIFSFGDASFFGSTGAIHLNKPVVGMAATPDGRGYWLVASDGGIFSFGDASFFGSTGAIHLNKPVVGTAATPDGRGYWLVASDGGIFSFGDAGFYGSTGAIGLNQPVVGMSTSADGHGYRLVASDGGIFSFGDAPFFGSVAGQALTQPVVGMTATPNGNGYWVVGGDGSVFAFGNATFFGSPSGE